MYNNDKIVLVNIDEKFYRPAEVDLLVGNSQLARKELDWNPKSDIDILVSKMVNFDYNELLELDRRR